MQQHPWFRVEALAASQRSAGQTYGEALRDRSTGALRWYAGLLVDKAIVDLPVEDVDPLRHLLYLLPPARRRGSGVAL